MITKITEEFAIDLMDIQNVKIDGSKANIQTYSLPIGSDVLMVDAKTGLKLIKVISKTKPLDFGGHFGRLKSAIIQKSKQRYTKYE